MTKTRVRYHDNGISLVIDGPVDPEEYTRELGDELVRYLYKPSGKAGKTTKGYRQLPRSVTINREVRMRGEQS